MGTAFLNIGKTDCCKLLHTCLPKAFHDGSTAFTTGVFECMVCLNKSTLKKVLATLLSHDDGEFEGCQLCGHEQGLLDELVQPGTTVLSLLQCVEL